MVSRSSLTGLFKSHTKRIPQKVFHLNFTPVSGNYPLQQIASLLQLCKSIEQHNQVHALLVTTGLIRSLPIASRLIVSLSSLPPLGTAVIARSIAHGVVGLHTFTWNSIIKGYLEENQPREAIVVYAYLRSEGFDVDACTLLFVVRACGLRKVNDEGRQIHAQVLRMGFAFGVEFQTALVNFYASCGQLNCMRRVFDESPHRDLVMSNSLVASYAQQNYACEALNVIRAMTSDNLRANGVTAASILSACSSLKTLREGKVVHGYVLRNLVDPDVLVYNALINMYSKCESLFAARQVFDKMPVRNQVSWTTIIDGYTENNFPSEAVGIFKEMLSENVRPDEITLLSAVSTCSKLGSFKLGEWLDSYVMKSELQNMSVSVLNALMGMHARCGNIKRACQVFDGMVEKSIVSWSTIINGLARHGHGVAALLRFCQMQREGFEPDGVIFLDVLSACSHAGLVDEGRKCFHSMVKDYHLEPWIEHYGCMVDMFCRAGLIEEALKFVGDMPTKPDKTMWRIMLRACQSQGNEALANHILRYSHDMGAKNSEDYTLLSNIYATHSSWDHVLEIRKEMRAMNVKKEDPGCSLVELCKL